MAILNFPSNPSTGDQYTENGVTYTWNGVAWTANGAENTDARYVQVTGDTMTGNLNVPSINGSTLGGFRNQMINGDFRVKQRGNGPFASGGGSVFTSDRFFVTDPAGRTYTFVRPFGNSNAVGITEFLKFDTANCVFGTNLELTEAGLSQFIQGQQYTVSFYGTPGRSFQVNIRFMNAGSTTGNILGAFTNLVEEATEITGLSRYTLTYNHTNANLAGTDTGISVIFVVPQANDVVGGFQLEPGPVATPFEHRPIATEIALCQRYYCKSYRINVAAGVNDGDGMCHIFGSSDASNNILCQVFLPVEMRANPTITAFYPGEPGNTWRWFRDGDNGYATVSSYRIGTRLLSLYVNVGAKYVSCNAAGHWIADAEL